METSYESLAVLIKEKEKEKLLQQKEDEEAQLKNYDERKEKAWESAKQRLHACYHNLKNMIENGSGDGKGVLIGPVGIDSGWAQDFAKRFNQEGNPIPETKVEVHYVNKAGLMGNGTYQWYIRVIPIEKEEEEEEEEEEEKKSYLGWLFG